MFKFIKSVKDEMKQVSWPSGKQLRKDVIVVIETSLLFALYFAVVDFVVEKVFSLVFQIRTKN